MPSEGAAGSGAAAGASGPARPDTDERLTIELMRFQEPPGVKAGERAELPDEVFAVLRRMIYEQAGIYFADSKKYLLESRIVRRVGALGLSGFPEYLASLRRGLPGELDRLVESVTINETFFFRHAQQIEALEREVLPGLVALRREDGSPINIWSAACSTGDEAYTLALLIRERFRAQHPAARFRIVGTDINGQVVETARRGEYRDYAVRNVPEPYLKKYFTHAGDRYRLRPEIREMVEFRRLNLYDRSALRTMRHFDLVLCANVLIYFDAESKQRVIAGLYESLRKGGVLFLGMSEALYGAAQGFRPAYFDRAVAYVKE